MSSPELILYDAAFSSYAQKVRIALREKNLPFIVRPPVGPNGPDPVLAAASPKLEIPCLIHGDVAIFDSTIILEYLEDMAPDQHPLLPPRSDPGARARARMIEDVMDTQYEAVNWGYGECLFHKRAGEPGSPLFERIKAEAISQLGQLYAWLTQQLGEHDWLGGRYGFGLADAALFPVLNRSVYYGFGPAPGSALDRWFSRVCERPSIKQTIVEFNDFLPTMYALAPKFAAGEMKREYRDSRLEFLVKSGGLEIVVEGLKKGNIRFTWPDAGKVRSARQDGGKI